MLERNIDGKLQTTHFLVLLINPKIKKKNTINWNDVVMVEALWITGGDVY